MKCRMQSLLLFVLLGAIVNIAVAWCIGACANIQEDDCEKAVFKQMPAGAWVLCRVWRAPDYHCLSWEHISWHDPSHESPDFKFPSWSSTASRQFFIDPLPPLAQPSAYSRFPLRRIELAAGWPFHSLRYCLTQWMGQPGTISFEFEPTYSAFRVGQPRFTMRGFECTRGTFPLLPIWFGFAGNAIFYAALARMLFAIPVAIRRRRRIKRGLCPACAYPVGSNAFCTECGKPVAPSRVEPI